MFYESRVHEILEPVTGYEELAAAIENSRSYQVCTIINNSGKKIGFVPDGVIDSPFDELAVVNISDGKQIESLTWAWVETNKAQALKDCAECTTVNMGPAHIPTSSQDNKQAYFTCGCCGNRFKSSIKEQVKFNQDAGYGICKSCEHYYL